MIKINPNWGYKVNNINDLNEFLFLCKDENYNVSSFLKEFFERYEHDIIYLLKNKTITICHKTSNEFKRLENIVNVKNLLNIYIPFEEKTLIHTPTLNSAASLLNTAYLQGIIKNEIKYDFDKWKYYKENTCYDIFACGVYSMSHTRNLKRKVISYEKLKNKNKYEKNRLPKQQKRSRPGIAKIQIGRRQTATGLRYKGNSKRAYYKKATIATKKINGTICTI